jgi:hypothetical protein
MIVPPSCFDGMTMGPPWRPPVQVDWRDEQVINTGMQGGLRGIAGSIRLDK